MKIRVTVWLIILFLMSGLRDIQAQWIPSEGIDGVYAEDLVVQDSTLFVCTGGNGIFSRNINGGTWEQKLPGTNFSDITSCLDALFAWNGYSCYRSLDHGSNWENMTGLFGSGPMFSFVAIDSSLIFSNPSGVFRSDDLGNTIYPVMSNLPNLEETWVARGQDSILFCFQTYQSHKLFQSHDKGITWDSISQAGLPSESFVITTMCSLDSNQWISSNLGVYKKNEAQGPWVLVQDSVFFRRMEILNGVLCASSWEQGFFRLDPALNQWIPENSGLETMQVTGFCANDSLLFLATGVGPYSYSTPYTWLPFYDGLHQADVRTIAFLGEEVWLVTTRGTFNSTDHGANFTKQPMNGLPDPVKLILTDSLFYAVSWNAFYVSHDHGSTWTKQNDGLPVPVQYPYLSIHSMALQGEYLFLGTNLGLYRSSCKNINWIRMTSMGSPDPNVTDLFCGDTTLFAVKTIYISGDYHYYTFRSTDHGQTFDSIGSLPSLPQPVFAGDGSDFYELSYHDLLKSEDEGVSWAPLPIGDSEIYGFFLSAQKPAVIVGGSKIGMTLYDIYLSITYNDGITWTDIRENLPVPSWPILNLLATNQQRIFVSPSVNGLWYQDGLLTGIGKDHPIAANRMTAAPNPASDHTTILFDLQSPCTGNITVRSMMGNTCYSGNTQRFGAGSHAEHLDFKNLLPGLYIVSLQTEKMILNCKLQVTE
jgi:hypothetical protein